MYFISFCRFNDLFTFIWSAHYNARCLLKGYFFRSNSHFCNLITCPDWYQSVCESMLSFGLADNICYLLSEFFYLFPYRIATLVSNSSFKRGSIELIIFTSIQHKIYFWHELNVQCPGSFFPFINRWCSQIFASFSHSQTNSIVVWWAKRNAKYLRRIEEIKIKTKYKMMQRILWYSMLDCTWMYLH